MPRGGCEQSLGNVIWKRVKKNHNNALAVSKAPISTILDHFSHTFSLHISIIIIHVAPKLHPLSIIYGLHRGREREASQTLFQCFRHGELTGTFRKVLEVNWENGGS